MSGGVTRSNSSGRFSFSLPRLEDGAHALSAESDGTLSEEVTIEIDEGSSETGTLTLTPNPASPGAQIQVSLQADENTESASITFEQLLVDLRNAGGGRFTATITAPNIEGAYPVDVSISDRLGNESTASQAAILRVDGTLRDFTFFVPSRVNNLQAQLLAA